MHRLFQIAHRRILTKIKGQSKEGIQNSEAESVMESMMTNIIPKNMHEHVKEYISDQNPQIKPNHFAFKHTTEIYHLIPKDQLKTYLRAPCPISKSFARKKDDQKESQNKVQVLSEVDQEIILNAKKLRSVMNVIEERVCDKCPFKQSCKFSTIKFEDLTMLEKQYKKYQNALELTPLQALIFHNQKMYQLGLLPESTFNDHFGYRVWASGYKIMDNLEALLKNLKESRLQTKQFLQIREKHIKQIKLQEAQGIRTKDQDQGQQQQQSVKQKKQKKKPAQKQEKLKVDFSDYAEQDVYKKTGQKQQLQKKQRKRGRNLAKSKISEDELAEEEDQNQVIFQSKGAKKSFYEIKQSIRPQSFSRRAQDNPKTNNPFTVKWSQEQEQNVLRNIKNELQTQDFQKKQSRRQQRQPRQQRQQSQAKPWQRRQPRQSKQWQQRQPRQSKPWQKRQPRQSKPWQQRQASQAKPWQRRQPRQSKPWQQRQSKPWQQRQSKPWQQRQSSQSKPWQRRQPRQGKPWQQRQPGQFKQRYQRQGNYNNNRSRNREGDYGQTNQNPRRNYERKDSYENSSVQKLGGQLRGDRVDGDGSDRRNSQGNERNSNQAYQRKRNSDEQRSYRPRRNKDGQNNGYDPSKRNK